MQATQPIRDRVFPWLRRNRNFVRRVRARMAALRGKRGHA